MPRQPESHAFGHCPRTAAVSETSRSVHKGYGYVGYRSAWRQAEPQRLPSPSTKLRAGPPHVGRTYASSALLTLLLVPVGHSRGPGQCVNAPT